MAETTQVTFDLGWLIAVVFLPVLGYAFKKISDLNDAVAASHKALDAYKLEVAEKYASVAHLQEIEGRLEAMLGKIFGKVDKMSRDLNRVQGKLGVSGD